MPVDRAHYEALLKEALFDMENTIEKIKPLFLQAYGQEMLGGPNPDAVRGLISTLGDLEGPLARLKASIERIYAK